MFSSLVSGQETNLPQQKNSAIVKLNGYIDNYLALTPFNQDSLSLACDHLISFSNDTLIKSHITRYLFEKFYNSNIMGMEGVAVHIGKEYYLGNKVKIPADMSLSALQLFVEFNENSLIGMKAPALDLKGIKGEKKPLDNIKANHILIYFFDDQCRVCMAELPELKKIVEEYSSKGLSVYAVYTQAGKENLLNFIKSQFDNQKIKSNWIFVWDPEFESNFNKKYNVLKTPQMFLLDNNKIIKGRNLDNQALRQLLELEYKQKPKQ